MTYKTYKCIVCDYIYNEELGDAEHGIAAGTLWQDVADNWVCPDCGIDKAGFKMVEI